jgi:hypothetical protein
MIKGRLVQFMLIYIVYFPVLVCLDREKSGNPDGTVAELICIHANRFTNIFVSM